MRLIYYLIILGIIALSYIGIYQGPIKLEIKSNNFWNPLWYILFWIGFIVFTVSYTAIATWNKYPMLSGVLCEILCFIISGGNSYKCY